MPNIVNTRMLAEIEGFLREAENCVVVDFTGMPVAVAEGIRTKLRSSRMQMHVVKTSLARIAARNLGYVGADQLLSGSSAMVFGGESVAEVARTVRDLAKASKTKQPVVRGGFLDRKALDPKAVDQLASLPSRPELLSQVLGTIIAPMTQSLGAIQSLLATVPGLTKAWEDKLAESGAAGAGAGAAADEAAADGAAASGAAAETGAKAD